MNDIINKLEQDYAASAAHIQELSAAANDYEDMEQAAERHYEEGFAAALEYVLRELKGAN